MGVLYTPLPQRKTEDSKSKPTLILSTPVFKKIHMWVWKAAEFGRECSGLGEIKKIKENVYRVDKVYLVKPKPAIGMFVDMDPQAVNELLMDLAMEDYTRVEHLRFLWHSHVHADVFWSSVDDKTAREDFCPDSPWTVNLVVNTKGHHLARMDFPEKRGKPVDNLNVSLEIPLYNPMKKKALQEYEEKHSHIPTGI